MNQWIKRLSALSSVSLLCIGCAANNSFVAPSELGIYSQTPASASGAASPSLFRDDQAVMTDAEVEKALDHPLTIPPRAKLAVVRFGQRPRWQAWSESFVRMNERIDADFLARLGASPRVREVAYLPSLVTPGQMTIPQLRQAASRFQADLILVYHTDSRTYDREKLFRANETKAYCTVEALLVDTRTGIIPFSTIATETFSATKTPEEIDFSETVAKANQQAIGKAWLRVADDVTHYMDKLPVAK